MIKVDPFYKGRGDIDYRVRRGDLNITNSYRSASFDVSVGTTIRLARKDFKKCGK